MTEDTWFKAAEQSSENANQQPNPAEKPLESWKEISAYLKRAVRTVKRWEKHEGLPVRRLHHQARASVYAYPSELDAWIASRQPESLRDEEIASPIPRWRALTALAAVLLLTLISVGSGPLPTRANATAGADVVARTVWTGSEVDPMGSPSSDGRLLSFVDWSTGDLAVRDLEKNVSRRLTNKGTWANSNEYAEFSVISPDAKQVAYAWYNEKFYELRLLGMDGTGQRVLYRNPEVWYVQPSAWSPDGKHIYTTLSRVDRTNQIVRVAVADGSVQVLKSFDWRYPQFKLSPDGRFIAYDFPPRDDRGDRDIYLLATDGGRELPLVQHTAHDFVLGWAPTGAGLVFASDRTGTVSAWLLPVDASGVSGEPKLVRQNLGNVFPIGLDGNGSFYYSMGGSRDVHVAEWDAVTGSFAAPSRNASERFVGSNSGPDWSPDGKYLSYVSRRGPPRFTLATVLVIRNLATGEEHEFQTKLRMNSSSSPRWTADGRSLLIWGTDIRGRRGFYLFQPESGETKTLLQWPATQNEGWPQLSADGKTLFYLSEDEHAKKAALYRLDLATGKKQILHASKHLHAPALSPDGQFILLPSTSPDQKEGVGMANRLLVIPVAGAEPRELRRLPADQEFQGAIWTPDGRSLLFIQGDQFGDADHVWRLSLDGGEPQPTQIRMQWRELVGMRFHPDGKRVAFTALDESEREIWVLQNFLPPSRAAK